MIIKTSRGIARIKKLGSGLGVRWYVFLPSTQTHVMGEIYTFMTKTEAVNFVKTLTDELEEGGAA